MWSLRRALQMAKGLTVAKIGEQFTMLTRTDRAEVWAISDRRFETEREVLEFVLGV